MRDGAGVVCTSCVPYQPNGSIVTRFLDLCRECGLRAITCGTLVAALAGGAALLSAIVFFVVFRFVDPPTSALMLRQSVTSATPLRQSWVDLETLPRHLVRTIVNSEDARFCRHGGIDFIELEAAFRQARKRGKLMARGASTISMQVVKNLVLWPGQTYLRKGLELALTPVMELVWPKSRILEVYLNIAEWGPGVFGVEAAARHHFKRGASRVSRDQAALLAAALPNPHLRRAGRPGPKTVRHARRLRRRAGRSGLDLSCVLQRR